MVRQELTLSVYRRAVRLQCAGRALSPAFIIHVPALNKFLALQQDETWWLGLTSRDLEMIQVTRSVEHVMYARTGLITGSD